MEKTKAKTSKRRVGQKDADLLRSASDRINGAVYSLLEAVMNNAPDASLSEKVVRAMLEGGGPDKLPEQVTWMARDIAAARLFDAGLQKENAILEWDTSPIEETMFAISGMLKAYQLPVCRPWQNDEEHICWSTKYRCKWCKRGCQTGTKEA